jgi:hypothetical protein
MWEQGHRKLLEHITPNEFDVLHDGAIAELRKGSMYRYQAECGAENWNDPPNKQYINKREIFFKMKRISF